VRDKEEARLQPPLLQQFRRAFKASPLDMDSVTALPNIDGHFTGHLIVSPWTNKTIPSGGIV